VDDQSWKTEYICLNLPEPLRLGSMEAVEKHFRETHKENIIKPAESHTLNGAAARALRCHELVRLVRSVWEDQRRFPLQIATVLSQQFAGHGLQFFKVNRTVTHVSVARPHYLDMAETPVSEGVKQIVEYINAHPKCNRRQLVEALAPSPGPATIPPAETTAAADQPAPPAASAEPTSEQTLVVSDLHWLVHEGHVIEFANGILETAKKPLPRPPKPEAKPAEQTAEPAPEPAAVVAGEAPVVEPAPETALAPAAEAGVAAEPAPPETAQAAAEIPATEPDQAAPPIPASETQSPAISEPPIQPPATPAESQS
jgi:hypothetical protein